MVAAVPALVAVLHVARLSVAFPAAAPVATAVSFMARLLPLLLSKVKPLLLLPQKRQTPLKKLLLLQLKTQLLPLKKLLLLPLKSQVPDSIGFPLRVGSIEAY